jgi:hypothetical protein
MAGAEAGAAEARRRYRRMREVRFRLPVHPTHLMPVSPHAIRWSLPSEATRPAYGSLGLLCVPAAEQGDSRGGLA